MRNKETFSALTKENKEAIGLLSMGTFLEYFDLLLYVHMSVLLNELFFPKTDPHIAGLLSAFAFCSSYVFRPLGALIFGYLGDTLGRKSTVIITTITMSLCCLTMFLLPTYEKIGITATYVMLLCRILQGMSSMAEVIGAELYITESTKPPIQYAAVALIDSFTALGGIFALGVALLATAFDDDFSWRYAFLFGALIAVIGAVARIRLRETPEFADAKRRIKNVMVKFNYDLKQLDKNAIWNEKVNKKTALCLFFMGCGWPACFYFAYVYCGDMLKTIFHFTPAAVIQHNFVLSIIQALSMLSLVFLSYKFHPLKILKAKAVVFLIFIACCPYLLVNLAAPWQLMLIQGFFIVFALTATPAVPILLKHFPVFKRFTYATFIYALARAFMYIVTSFGLVFFVRWGGYWAVLLFMLPVAVIFLYSVYHFETLEQTSERLF